MTTLDRIDGVDLGRVRIDRASQDDLDALFKLLMPEQPNEINLRKMATCEGNDQGLFTTALYNSAAIDFGDMREKLIEINADELV